MIGPPRVAPNSLLGRLGSSRQKEIISSRKRIVAVEHKYAAVDSIRTALGRDKDLRAAIAIFRRRIIRDDHKLSNGIERRNCVADSRIQDIVDGDAVHALVDASPKAAARDERVGARALHATHQPSKTAVPARPSRGGSSIWSASITVVMANPSVWMRGETAFTTTVEFASPISGETSSRTVWSASRLIWLRMEGLNPGLLISSRYTPGSTELNEYSPSVLVGSLRAGSWIRQ
jgi:hypothetical protein